MKKRNEDDLNDQEKHSEELSAEDLKELNYLLERLHQADYKLLGNIEIHIYKPGSQHVDHVENQNFYGYPCPKPKKTPKGEDTSTTERFGKDTPLSDLFRENHHEELKTVIESWRPYLVDNNPSIDALKMNSFHFDFGRIIATSVYIDLGPLLNNHALKDDNMSQLANYLYLHSNLSSSQPTLYAQLRKYKKR
jgi:hypothetical protein